MTFQGNREEEAAIARTPKASEAKKPAAKAPAKPGGKAPAKAKPAAKAKAAARPKAAAKAAKPAAKKPTAPKAARPVGRPGAKPVRKPAPKATPQLKASAAAAAKRAAPPRPDRPPRARKPKVEPALLDRLVVAAQKSLEDDKAEDVVVLDVTGRADYADRLVIATGLADRQIQAMATHLEDAFEKQGLKLRRDATSASGDWVLIDAGDLVVHLFKPEARSRYALERMWGPDSPAPEGPQDRSVLPDDGIGGSTATEDDDD
ncbi:ribosome silencing factor [Falsiroseomonas sp. HW251]|uniref:ribosome silencing factor n=1 Tax=Falsiroseomonas sp. HW251 TaxID=3390998 RepID=UPI003D31DD53